MSKDMKEAREAFEADYTKRYLGVNVGSALDKFESGMYKQADTHFVWLGFQAAWEIQQKRVEELRKQLSYMCAVFGMDAVSGVEVHALKTSEEMVDKYTTKKEHHVKD